MVDAAALSQIDAVGIVTGAAGGSLGDDMEPVAREAFVVENAVAAVTAVTEGIGLRTLGREIRGCIIPYQQRGKDRGVGAIGTAAAGEPGVVAVVAVGTGDDAPDTERGDQADHIGVATGAADGVKRGIRRLELKPGVGLGNLAAGRQPGPGDSIGMALEADFV